MAFRQPGEGVSARKGGEGKYYFSVQRVLRSCAMLHCCVFSGLQPQPRRTIGGILRLPEETLDSVDLVYPV
jgi:hypothetical protein